jgi:hypothetical protein
MSHTLSDGTLIEWTYSDGHSGPAGKPGCQRTSHNVVWYRINGGEWSLTAHRNAHKFVDWISICENLTDFLDGEKF